LYLAGGRNPYLSHASGSSKPGAGILFPVRDGARAVDGWRGRAMHPEIVRDQPALAQAVAGIAMGTGTGVAIKSAGVTLVKGDLTGIVRAGRLSVLTLRNIKQNLVFTFSL
jgi:hypothetical protein